MRPSDRWTDEELQNWVGPQAFAKARKILLTAPPQIRRDEIDYLEGRFDEKAGMVHTMIRPGPDPAHSRLTCTCPEFEEGPCRHAAALVLFTRRKAEPNTHQDAIKAALAAFRPQVADADTARVMGFKLTFGFGEPLIIETCRLRSGVKHFELVPALSAVDHPPPYADDASRAALDRLRPFVSGRRFVVAPESIHTAVSVLCKTVCFVRDPLQTLTWESAPHTVSFVTHDLRDGITIAGTLVAGNEKEVALTPHSKLLGSGSHNWLYDGASRMSSLALSNPSALLEVVLPGPYYITPRDLERWMTELLPALRSWGPVELRDTRSPAIVETEPLPAIVLEEKDSSLRVGLRVRYPPSQTLLAAGAGGYHVEGRTWFVRNAEAETRYKKLLSAFLLTEPIDTEGRWMLTQDRPLVFLEDELPKLDGRWEVYGRDELAEFKLSSQVLLPSLRVSTNLDWFEAAFEFSAGEERLDGWAILAAWDKGKRFLKTNEGFVRLPADLLRKLRERLAELPEGNRLHRTQAGLLSAMLEETPDAVTDEGWRETARALENLQAPAAVPVPPGLQAEMRPYQKQGLDWLAFLNANRFGGILADDMGLGKTLQTISFLLHHREQGNQEPVLVVAPSSVVFNWEREIAKFAPSLSVLRWTGDARAEKADQIATANVVLTNYAILRRDIGMFCKRTWGALVLDEAQAIKNANSLTAECARAVPASFRLALTGTPVENHLGELWSYFEFLMPGFFGSLKSFNERYLKRLDQPGSTARALLKKRITPFVLRRLKQMVAADLPPKTEMVVMCELGDAQRNAYQSVRAAYKLSLFEKIEKDGLSKSRMHVLEALLRLRQASCDPRLLPYEHTKSIAESAKGDALFELVEEAVDEDHKMIVFSQFTEMLNLIEKELITRGIAFARLDGSTADREAPVNRFQNDPACKIILVSLRAGGTGLNLTAADYVVHYDPWWNPAVEDQATDRAYRIGQTRPVFVYKLVAKNTVEELMIELQNRKRGLVDSLLGDGDGAPALTVQDLEEIFRDVG